MAQPPSEETDEAPEVGAVVREVIAEIAPDEIPVVDSLALLDNAVVVRRLQRRRNVSEPLGFGVEDVVVMLTPVVWLVVEEIASRGAGGVVEGTVKGGKSLWRRLSRRPGPPPKVPRLKVEQSAAVRQLVSEEAERQGLEASQATAIADAVLRRLVFNGQEIPSFDPTDTGDPADDD